MKHRGSPNTGVDHVLAEVLRDFEPVSAVVGEVTLVDLGMQTVDVHAAGAQHLDLMDERELWWDPRTDTEAPLILIVHHCRRRIAADADHEEMKVQLADYLQDIVIDETGKAWPIVADESGVSVLSPTVEQGVGVWAGASGLCRRIGQLWA